MLGGLEIRKLVVCGSIVIKPFNMRNMNPNSYNLTLDKKLLVYREHYLDSKIDNPTVEIEIDEKDGFILHPGRIYLGSTVEYTETKYHVPAIEGRSSLGRLGLDIHATAGFGDIGFKGVWTLELSVKQPLKIYAGMQIAQICYHPIQGDYLPYDGKYQGQTEAIPSRVFSELQVEGEKCS